MSGFRLKKRTARLRFEGTNYDGAEVELSLNVSVGTYRAMSESKDAQDFETVIAMLCDSMVLAWNLEDEQGPIPVTPEGFDRIDDLGFLNALLDGWQAAMTGKTEVAVPLGESSMNGHTSGNETQPEYLAV